MWCVCTSGWRLDWLSTASADIIRLTVAEMYATTCCVWGSSSTNRRSIVAIWSWFVSPDDKHSFKPAAQWYTSTTWQISHSHDGTGQKHANIVYKSKHCNFVTESTGAKRIVFEHNTRTVLPYCPWNLPDDACHVFAQWRGWEAWDSRSFTTHHVTVCVNTLFAFSMLFRWNNTDKQAKYKNGLTAELASTWCFVLIHIYLVTLQVLQLFEFDIGTKTWMADDFN